MKIESYKKSREAFVKAIEARETATNSAQASAPKSVQKSTRKRKKNKTVPKIIIKKKTKKKKLRKNKLIAVDQNSFDEITAADVKAENEIIVEADDTSVANIKKKRKKKKNGNKLIKVESSSFEEVATADAAVENGATDKAESHLHSKKPSLEDKPAEKLAKKTLSVKRLQKYMARDAYQQNSKKRKMEKRPRDLGYTITHCISMLRQSPAWPHDKNPDFNQASAIITLRFNLKEPKRLSGGGLRSTIPLPHARSLKRRVLLISTSANLAEQQEAFEILGTAVGIKGSTDVLPLSDLQADPKLVETSLASYDTLLVSQEVHNPAMAVLGKELARTLKSSVAVDLSEEPVERLRCAMACAALWQDRDTDVWEIKVGDSSLSPGQICDNVYTALKAMNGERKYINKLYDLQATIQIGYSPPLPLRLNRIADSFALLKLAPGRKDKARKEAVQVKKRKEKLREAKKTTFDFSA